MRSIGTALFYTIVSIVLVAGVTAQNLSNEARRKASEFWDPSLLPAIRHCDWVISLGRARSFG